MCILGCIRNNHVHHGVRDDHDDFRLNEARNDADHVRNDENHRQEGLRQLPRPKRRSKRQSVT